jgi:hypothetical protein
MDNKTMTAVPRRKVRHELGLPLSILIPVAPICAIVHRPFLQALRLIKSSVVRQQGLDRNVLRLSKK